jgi:hypothetical protein
MGQGKQTPCKGCGKGCYGDACRGCVEAARHKQFAAGSGAGVCIPKVAPTVGAWWANAPREGFGTLCEQHADRMSRGVASHYRPSPEVWL